MSDVSPTPKPRIVCLSNGPYYLLNDLTPRVVPHLQRQGGETCRTVAGVALCRCGGSKNKPFCDGTHGSIGFSDRNLSDPGRDRREDYPGQGIVIHDNRSLCAHAGHCTEGLGAVFRMREEPWIRADAADAQAIIQTIRRCPSGALSYSVDGVEHRDQERPPMVTVIKDGPYEVTGGVELVGVTFGAGASREHYCLCRCGASRNKPFCDGSHWRVGFRDG